MMETEYPDLVIPEPRGERVYSESQQPGPKVDLMARRAARPQPTPEEIEAKQKAYDTLTGKRRGLGIADEFDRRAYDALTGKRHE